MGQSTVRAVLQQSLRVMATGAVAGAVAGLLWGGIGGRIAMRVVFLTSDPGVAGVESDDGFVIGQISAATGFLIMFTTLIGGMVGTVAGVVRSWMRSGTVVSATAFTVAGALFGGGSLVHADGIDFRLLEPLALTVGLFMLIPAGWAATTVVLIDRWRHREAWTGRLPLPLLALPLMVLVAMAIGDNGGPALIVLPALAVIGLFAAAVVSGRLVLPWLGAAGNAVAWGFLGWLAVVGTMDLARDLAALT